MSGFLRTRWGSRCPFCLRKKNPGIITHWDGCYGESGFKIGEPEAITVVDAFERYLEALDEYQLTFDERRRLR